MNRTIDNSKLLPRGISKKHAGRHHDKQVRDAVKNLKKKIFIEPISKPPQSRGEVVDLTFHGLFLYLKYAGEDGGIGERMRDQFNRCLKWQENKKKGSIWRFASRDLRNLYHSS